MNSESSPTDSAPSQSRVTHGKPRRRLAPLRAGRRSRNHLNRPEIVSESTRAGGYGTHALRAPAHGSGAAAGATWGTFGAGPYYSRATPVPLPAAHPRSRSPSRRCTRDCRPARIVASASPAAWAATMAALSGPGWRRSAAARFFCPARIRSAQVDELTLWQRPASRQRSADVSRPAGGRRHRGLRPPVENRSGRHRG